MTSDPCFDFQFGLVFIERRENLSSTSVHSSKNQNDYLGVGGGGGGMTYSLINRRAHLKVL